MRNVLLDILKSYSHKAFLQARSQLSLTQAQMADRLSMDTRSYVYLEHGETMLQRSYIGAVPDLLLPRSCQIPEGAPHGLGNCTQRRRLII